MKLSTTFALLAIALPMALASPALVAARTDSVSKRGESYGKDRVYSSSDDEKHYDEDYDYNHKKHFKFNAYDGEQKHEAKEMSSSYKKDTDCSSKSRNDWDLEMKQKCDEWSEKEESGKEEEAKKSDKGHYYNEEEEDRKEDNKGWKEDDEYKREREGGREKGRKEDGNYKNGHEGGREKGWKGDSDHKNEREGGREREQKELRVIERLSRVQGLIDFFPGV